jgi:hypothetical protein
VALSLYFFVAFTAVTDFLKGQGQGQACIFKEFDQFYREAVNIKIPVINKYILFVQGFCLKKGPCMRLYMSSLTHRNIKQTPRTACTVMKQESAQL